ncbi:MAG: restriction endonuclease [Planctomycetes bacterium]|nr:restriction endonuclease [Planctomycetota bacterium]MBI3833789.1 restriction endonuclease [Planctomycetota bacterium]
MARAGDNVLYYGDNLDILRRYIKDESVDLVYLDPPFNSSADYNVLFAERDGTRAHAQIKAFGDTWTWDQEAAANFEDVLHNGGDRVAQAMLALRTFLGTSDMLAYLSMMAPRLVELRRVLKLTGSIYLHCDPTASHYLKLLMDSVFRPQNFRNEIIWRRTLSKSLMRRRLPRNHDVIIAFQRSDQSTWNDEVVFTPYDEENLGERTADKYRHIDADGRKYRLDNLINPNRNRPNLRYAFLGVTRVWRWTKDRMQKAYDEGLIVQTRPGRVPQLKRYLDEQRGVPFGDVWTDIPPINSQARERLGYPTQKPEALLERIIRSASNERDVVLDPFCGCGTAVAVAQRLKRRWIGIDITHLVINLVKTRIRDAFGPRLKYRVVGEPVSLPDARDLARNDAYQFQWWALGLVGARPVEQQKGADKGIDGRLYFHDSADASEIKQIVVSVKAGQNIGVSMVRDLVGVVQRERAAMAVLITMEEPTKPMRTEAASAGFYESPSLKKTRHPRVQIFTIEELLAGKKIDMPGWHEPLTFKKAPRAKSLSTRQSTLPFKESDDE